MAERGLGFWKIFLGVVVGIVVGGACLVGGCVVLFGKACQQAVQQIDQKQAEYLQQKMRGWRSQPGARPRALRSVGCRAE